MGKKVRCMLILFTTAAIWGGAYVAQKFALGRVGSLTLNTLRGFTAWVFLIPCCIFLEWYQKRTGKVKKTYDKQLTIRAGVRSGIFLCIASTLQAYGIRYSEVGKAGFLTALYIIIVPVFSAFIGKKCRLKVWISVGLALLGTCLLCVKRGVYIEYNDVYLILCAIFFAINIVSISTVCDRVDSVKMSMVQFFVSSFITLIPAILLEHIELLQIVQALPVILYSGIFSCGIGYTIEIIGQDGLDPTVASLILSFESVFSLLAGWLFMRETLSGKELLGCAIIIFAVILTQLPIGTIYLALSKNGKRKQ